MSNDVNDYCNVINLTHMNAHCKIVIISTRAVLLRLTRGPHDHLTAPAPCESTVIIPNWRMK